MDEAVAIPVRKKRNFVAEGFKGDTWGAVEPYYQNLLARDIASVDELQQWLRDWSELDAILNESKLWNYVQTTLDTNDETAKAALTNIYTKIFPNTAAYENLLKKKLIDCEFTRELNPDSFFTTIRRFKKEIEIFREANLPLLSQLNIKATHFDQITGAQSIIYHGEEITPQQAGAYLKNTNRTQREEIFNKLCDRRREDEQKLDDLLTEMIQMRHQVALNAGHKNYIDYRFDELGRFDYTVADCLNFHRSVEKVVMPLVDSVFESRKQKLGLEVLRPWDTDVDIIGKEPLKPFDSTDDLINKTITCFNRIDPYFGQRIDIMNRMKFLDIDPRMNKGTGGYNIALPEIGVPFLFMNSANSDQDLIIITHEGGHAIHTFLTRHLELTSFKEVTPEIGEVASMSMELFTMENWDVFYPDADDLRRARRNHLQYILTLIPKTCQGDSFQFWLYANPFHTIEERRKKWAELHQLYTAKAIDYSGYENALETGYQRVLHFYLVPLYYIEYAFAQLGALALWKNFRTDKAQTISNYKKALSLGYTRTIPGFYETAGIKFDFSESYIASIIGFVEQELENLSS